MRTVILSVLIALSPLAFSAGSSAQNPEDFARRQYESGLAFLQNAKYAEALKDFQVIIDSFPQSSVADDALLQLALYHLDVTRDLVAAQAATDRLIKDYSGTDSAPMAYVNTGRLTIAKGRTPANVDAALASFERVPRLFPGSEAVAAARYFAGETLRLVRRGDEALDRFRRVTLEYPRSRWSARADLAMVPSLVGADRATQAFPRLQRIRQQFPGLPEAQTALAYNTMLYRLYLRAKPQAPYRFSGRFIGTEASRFRDIVGVTVDETGRILLGHKAGISIFDEKGTVLKSINAAEASAFWVEDRSRVMWARRDAVMAEGGATVLLTVPQPGENPKPVEEIPSVVVLFNGDRLVANPQAKTVIRVSSAGKFLSNFATAVKTQRLARNDLDDVAMIDQDSKAIVVIDRDGKPITKIPAKGTTYAFDEPVDLEFDALGHLYVVDGNRAAIHVFGANYKPIASITSASKEAGALQKPKALGIDASGRLYVFDESSQRIQVYQ